MQFGQDGGCFSLLSWLRPGQRAWLIRLAWLAAIGAAQAQTPTESVILSFSNFPHGANPYAPLALDSAGNLYGTACQGGQSNFGVVFKLASSGAQTVLHSFTGGADGGNPYAGVIRSASGNIYGTTYQGGAANLGVVYRLDASGRETVLHNFKGGADGANPYAGVVADPAGNLYGTTYKGGPSNAGTVYELTPSGQETVLYSFTGGDDGGNPYAGVILDAAGNLYGTAYAGGSDGGVVVYKLSPSGQETVLHAFEGSKGGEGPYAGVVSDGAGNLYGAVARTVGQVYKLDAAGQYTVLHQFYGAGPAEPEGGLVRDAAGNLYGTVQYDTAGGGGVVYEIDAAGDFRVLYKFPGASSNLEPLGPNAGLIRDSEGSLYGTTTNGGVGGMVYKVDTSGQGTMLYSFSGASGGTHAWRGVVRSPSGELYGTTAEGGVANAGVVCKVDLTGHETVLYSFSGGADGARPGSGVVLDSAGNLYGTNELGGAANQGVVYKVGASGQQTVLYSFTGGADGGEPFAGVIRDSAGNLYGTTFLGGAGAGVVYKLNPAGEETVLYSFAGGADGGFPESGVISDSAGNLYGTAYSGGAAGLGVVYKVAADGQETVLYSFPGGPKGALPYSGLAHDAAGNLYGTTAGGGGAVGEAGAGLVFELGTSGEYTVLYTFTGGRDGGGPIAGVIRDAAGNLYGTTSSGGAAGCGDGCGVVYELDAGGHETVLHAFTGGADGATPYAGVVADSDGNLYGTTPYGGKGLSAPWYRPAPA
jgi:uncharacterized repeat protein (TIGR03803 family)